jgi:hypothetical protein
VERRARERESPSWKLMMLQNAGWYF